jgi:hypothetical protein
VTGAKTPPGAVKEGWRTKTGMESADKKIAKFLKASNDLEKYLHGKGALTPLQQQTIETTIMGLKTLLEAWEQEHRTVEDPSLLPQITPRKAQGS